MNILKVVVDIVDLLIEGLNINQDVFDDDIKNINYKQEDKTIFYDFSKTFNDSKLKVHFEIYDQVYCYVGFTVNGLYVKEKKAKYDLRLALQVMGYVISCMRSIQNMYPTIELFEFAADEPHEAQYDKLLPRLSSKLGFTYTKTPYTAKPTIRDKIEKNVKMSACYEIYLQ